MQCTLYIHAALTQDHQSPSLLCRNHYYFAINTEFDHLTMRSHCLYFIHTIAYQLSPFRFGSPTDEKDRPREPLPRNIIGYMVVEKRPALDCLRILVYFLLVPSVSGLRFPLCYPASKKYDLGYPDLSTGPVNLPTVMWQ